MKIKEIKFKDNWGNPQNYKVGKDVDKIIEHSARGEGDKWYYDIYFKNNEMRYDIYFKNNEMRRVFTPTEVIFEGYEKPKICQRCFGVKEIGGVECEDCN